MKIKRFGQSCLLIEKNGKRLLIDPGSLFAAKHRVSDVLPLDATLYTHEHPDHLDPSVAKNLMEADVPIYSHISVAKKLGEKINMLEANQSIELAGFGVKIYEFRHRILTGVPEPQNFGYLIDNKLLVTGDSADVDIKAEVVAVPFIGVDISPRDAIDLINATEPKKALVVHYDFFGADPRVLKNWYHGEAELLILADGESTEI